MLNNIKSESCAYITLNNKYEIVYASSAAEKTYYDFLAPNFF